MINYLLSSMMIALSFMQSPSDPMDVLKVAREKIQSHQRISYDYVGLYPNPAGSYDTAYKKAYFVQNAESPLEFDFIIKGDFFDHVLIDGDFRLANAFEKTVTLYPDDRPELIQLELDNASSIKRSSISLLKEQDWEYVKDTVMAEQEFANYSRVLVDKIHNGGRVLTEQHIFINKKTHLLEGMQRRNYYKGNLTQRYVITYKNYQLSQSPAPLKYELPEGYSTVFYGQVEEKEIIAVGSEAPDFSVQDLEGNQVNLADYKGKKVLLNFSSIGCGYCHQAVQFFNENDLLPEDMVAFYVSVFDKKEMVKDYFQKIKAPYTVIPDGEELRVKYSAISTPNFILINEEGVVEKTVVGFDKEFLKSLKKE